MMKSILVLLAVLLTGCATSAGPDFVNGRYYMTGDPDCRFRESVSATRIVCANAKKQVTGYRDAMTDQQLFMHQQAMLRYQLAAQQSYTPPVMQPIQYPKMETPQVMPIRPPGGNQIRCITAGIYTNCRY